MLPFGVLLLERDRYVRYANRTAAALIEARRVLRADRGSVEPLVPSGAWEHALRTVLRGGARLSGEEQPLHLRLSGSEGAVCDVMVLPTQARQGSDPGAMVLLFPSEGGARCDHRLLQRLYGLSSAESNVVLLLMEGKSPQEVAARLEVTISTVRSHLRRIFEKTGTRGQSELLFAVAMGPAMLRWDRGELAEAVNRCSA